MTGLRECPSEFVLEEVNRTYTTEASSVRALDAVSLEIQAGDYVAITGRSGSGKSSLLNMLGLLDRPDAGFLALRGVTRGEMSEADCARLRSRHIGFVFQSFQLLPDLTALENVALAGLYTSLPAAERIERAALLLARVGLSDRMSHFPAQLSGGQQQRVAIARALFSSEAILLADEPTGSLDSISAEEVLDLFDNLHRAGVTIVVVTHDPKVAARAARVIEMFDGKIVADRAGRKPYDLPLPAGVCGATEPGPPYARTPPSLAPKPGPSAHLGMVREMLVLALLTLARRPVRTALTVFGNIVGIAAIIVIIGVGEGARRSVDQTLSSLGANLVVVMIDETRLPLGSPQPEGFTTEEVAEVKSLPQVIDAVLQAPRRERVQAQTRSAEVSVTATLAALPRVNDWQVTRGSFFTDHDNTALAAVAVLGHRAAEKLFANEDPLGQEIQIGQSVFDVIGVMAEKGANPSGFDLDDVVLVPFETARARLGRTAHAEFLMAKIAANARLEVEASRIQDLLETWRGRPEVVSRSLSSIIEAQLKARDTLTVLLGSLAFISLVVGSVGITNITLVSIIERTREIGLRKALGATERNIMAMVIVETGLISFLGGTIGVCLGLAIIGLMQIWGLPAVAVFGAPALATVISLGLGFLAGAYPARRAARLDPVRALMSM